MFGWSCGTLEFKRPGIDNRRVDLSDPVVSDVMAAWRRAYEAIDAVCSEFAALPGASQQYVALCKLAKEFQEAARGEIEAGIALARLMNSKLE